MMIKYRNFTFLYIVNKQVSNLVNFKNKLQEKNLCIETPQSFENTLFLKLTQKLRYISILIKICFY